MSGLALHEVQPSRRADVARDAIVRSRAEHDREHRRPRALTAREALQALQFEALLVAVVAGNLRSGADLTDDDWRRFDIALQRIQTIAEEATR